MQHKVLLKIWCISRTRPSSKSVLLVKDQLFVFLSPFLMAYPIKRDACTRATDRRGDPLLSVRTKKTVRKHIYLLFDASVIGVVERNYEILSISWERAELKLPIRLKVDKRKFRSTNTGVFITVL